jgi:nucleoside-diphosphate-sugar epimerase
VLNLITGSSGLLGSCLTQLLLGRGERLRLFDLVPPTDDGEAGERAEFVQGDLRNEPLIANACRGVDTVYHLAALQRMKPHVLRLSEQEIYDVNVTATANLLRAARAAGVHRVVFVSSSGVYGIPQRQPVDEHHPLRPIGSYGRSKVRAEELCGEYLDGGLDVSILRPVSLFGPGMGGVFLLLFEWVRSGRPVYIMGSGRNRVSLASAWDVAEACHLAAMRPESRGQAFNLGSAGVPTVREQVQALIDHAGSRSRIVSLNATLLRTAAKTLHRLGLSPLVPEHFLLADRDFLLDHKRAERVLGWVPRFTNTDMTAEAYNWYARCWPAARPASNPILRLVDLVSRA